ncbi:MAG: hypothetical protein DRN00_04815 [Thermoplasmata archaeon]|nr:MAG: hypothetical protein DRN00_04815 [Thermoplasmata archaeon]
MDLAKIINLFTISYLMKQHILENVVAFKRLTDKEKDYVRDVLRDTFHHPPLAVIQFTIEEWRRRGWEYDPLVVSEMEETYAKYTFDKVAPIIDKCVEQNDTLMDIHACLSREIPTESDFVINGAINLAGEKILERLRYSTAFNW